VAGAALLPAAAMMEMLLAAAAAVAADGDAGSPDGAASWALSRVAIRAPVLLPPPREPATPGPDAVLVCAVQPGSGALRLTHGGRTVAEAHATRVEAQPSRNRGATEPQPLGHATRAEAAAAAAAAAPPDSDSGNGSGRVAAVLVGLLGCMGLQPPAPPPPTGPLARLDSAAASPEDGWALHPAAADAAFHLGVLGRKTAARIPVAAGLVALPLPAAARGRLEWASAAPVGLRGGRAVTSFSLLAEAAGEQGASAAVCELATVAMSPSALAAFVASAAAQTTAAGRPPAAEALGARAADAAADAEPPSGLLYETALEAEEPSVGLQLAGACAAAAALSVDTGAPGDDVAVLRIPADSEPTAAAASALAALQAAPRAAVLRPLVAPASASKGAAAAVEGLLRTAASELPASVLAAVLPPSAGVAVRRTLRHAFDPPDDYQPPPPLPAEAYSLQPQPRGAFANLAVVPAPPEAQLASRTLPAGKVALRVRAVGLNFRDVLNVLGMYPGDPGDPGSDCAGVVESAGELLGVQVP
jgi:hypothetical protein